MKKPFLLTVLAGALILVGCESTDSPKPKPAPGPAVGQPVAPAQPVKPAQPKKVATDRNKVLNEYKAATIAMRNGNYAEAKVQLDDALLTINNIFGNNHDAKRARSYFSEESKKTFVGEPYERVMANYYRGILYWMDGEPDNARACFRNGQYEDSDAENKAYSQDYVLLDYLDGLASVKLAGDGSDHLKSAKASAKMAVPPDPVKANNVLFFVEMGQGPVKYADGKYQEFLRFRPGSSAASKALIKIATATLMAPAYDDLSFQATTRGGRLMDHILGNKAVFKSTTDTVGNAALVSGAALGAAGGNNEAALGVAAAGLVFKLLSAASTPKADIRCWDNLPNYLSFSSARLAPGDYSATVEFLNGGGAVVGVPRTVNFKVTGTDRDTVVFVSDRN